MNRPYRIRPGRSKAQGFAYQDKFDTACGAAMAGDEDLVADAGLAFAIGTGAGGGAGIGQ